jgi:hypothetical protein
MRKIIQHDHEECRLGESGSAGIIALVIVVLFVLASLGYITINGLQTTKTVAKPLAAAEPTPGATATPAPNTANGESKTDAAGAQNQTVNINISGDTNNAAADQKKAVDGKIAAEDKKAPDPAKQEKLAPKYDPNSPNPTESWTNDEKVKAPVRYYTVLLEYLKEQKYKVQRDRFTIGKQSKIFEQKLKEAQLDVAGNRAMLEKAARIAIEANKNDAYPVSFAYKTYTRDEFKIKIYELRNKYNASRIRAVRMENFSQSMKDRLHVHDQQLELLENGIRECAENIEMFRSDKLTDITKERIKKLDDALAESSHSLEETMRKAEQNVNKPVVLEQSEAEMNYEDILKKFGPQKK